MFLGLAIASPTALAFVAGIAFLGSQALRMGYEENALASAFPEYASYAASTGRVIPRMPRRGHALRVPDRAAAGA
jgi:protein-S-isoprenylcysteine O-methyltransferase Ste14